MNNGMRPSVFHNPDPTYEKTKTNLNQEYKRNRCEVERLLWIIILTGVHV